MAETDIRELLLTTTCAGALGIVAAEIFRAIIQRVFKPRTPGYLQLNDFIHSTISAFILIVCAYERAMLLWAGMRGTFFFLTFLLCILYGRIFSSCSPSPCFPLELNWRRIRQSGIVLEKDKENRGVLNMTSLLRMIVTYFRLGVPFILGQFFGLVVAIQWLKFYWNGWVTSSHVTNLPVLDECIQCLNTTTIYAFILETVITFTFLTLFNLIDKMSLPHVGANKLLQTFLARNALKSSIVITSMYFFMDVTGSFANPFYALAMQRHCMIDVTSAFSIVIVYVIAPFAATITYLVLNQSEVSEKSKRSV